MNSKKTPVLIPIQRTLSHFLTRRMRYGLLGLLACVLVLGFASGQEPLPVPSTPPITDPGSLPPPPPPGGGGGGATTPTPSGAGTIAVQSFCGDSSLGGVGFDPNTIDLESLLPTPNLWLRETMCIMDDYNIAKHTNSLGFALLFACFVYSLVNATYFFRSDQYFSIIGRLIIAAGLIFAQPVIAKGVMNAWEGIYNSLQTSVVDTATGELEQNMNTLAPQLKRLAIETAKYNFIASAIPAIKGIDVGNDLVGPFAKMTQEATRSLFMVMVLMGSVYGIYFLSIYVSGMIAVLAGVLLSVLAAMLVLPGMTSWFTRWFSMVFLSLAMVAVYPFVFSVVVRLGVSMPLSEISRVVTEMQALDDQTNNGTGGNLVELVKDVAENGMEAFIPKGFDWGKLYFRWIFALIVLVISVLASIFILQRIPALLSGFIGGNAGGAASAVTGSALAGVFAGGAAALGGAGGAVGGAAGALMKGGGGAPRGGSPRENQAALPPAGGSGGSGGSGSGGSGSGGSGGPGPSNASSGSPRDNQSGPVTMSATTADGGGNSGYSPTSGYASSGGGSGGSASLGGSSSNRGGGSLGSSRTPASLPSAGSTGAYAKGASASSNGAASVQRGDFRNDPSVKTVNTTATGGRTNPRG
ncbi:MAG: hypothetical protein ACRCYY_14450 [Trueperaceae bacterium]